MIILGLTHPYGWNTAAALIRDGKLVAFAEEERFTRQKHAPLAFPAKAMAFALKEAGITLDQVDRIAIGMDSKWSVILPNFFPWQPLRLPWKKVRQDHRPFAIH